MKPLLLVVDDDIDDIEFVQDAISQLTEPPELKYFLDGEEFLKYINILKISSSQPFAITLDINLPGINGIELLSILRENNSLNHIPIYMITTANSVEQKNICLNMGANQFYSKPVENKDWIKIVKSIVKDIILK